MQVWVWVGRPFLLNSTSWRQRTMWMSTHIAYSVPRSWKKVSYTFLRPWYRYTHIEDPYQYRADTVRHRQDGTGDWLPVLEAAEIMLTFFYQSNINYTYHHTSHDKTRPHMLPQCHHNLPHKYHHKMPLQTPAQTCRVIYTTPDIL